ncbi:glycosyltransferase [Mycolicibacterium brumae]|uniref:4,4'-diaponeurosporenoate glycosyltransferase n=1 Tax=Mycolicibacterium brumae TaxID=85968 RepID=A0A2G5PDY4_9MYCO|nr:glycosyltransferase [Mycolicibacterium brumae]MCV7192721.1 glycosyltransferase [Mycolicibacterium brumae]PIB76542.1 glycosyl transferase family 2 [Mycolicibacterium brumae]RWA23307.1 hypothetical protein MBRU_00375 [Mycolicibacterium brumae DSM 44177]UWW08765.1 glycosyltransferase [Mycolicibacterium brumae]
MSSVRRVEIVVPAHNEQRHLQACVRGLLAAVEHIGAARPEVSCGVTIVLDRCTDDSVAVLRELPIQVLPVDAGCVGAARKAGVAAVLASCEDAGYRHDEVWIANTDADTVVPTTWLETQLRLAEAHDAVIGTVTPFGLTDDQHRLWLREYHLNENHPHVHGANLGVRADTYLLAGGFRELDSDEDVDLVARIKRVTTRWIATHQTNVRTSGRETSRVEGGFASYVGDLESGA